MVQMYGHQIVSVEPRGGKVLRVFYTDGAARDFDFAQDAGRGGFFSSIEESGFALDYRIAPNGSGLEWPSGMGYCADFLWVEGQPVEVGAEPADAKTPVTITSH